jgi:hypothetical protein
MFDLVDEISGSKKITSKILPNMELSILPDLFADFFADKIVKIREDLSCDDSFVVDVQTHDICFEEFVLMSPSEMKKVVLSMKSKSCSLDPLPTNFVKSCIDTLVPILTQIVNNSFRNGVFPDDCKTALVRPVIKKLDLDRDILKHYRPVSNCSFLDKLLEKCAYNQLNEYLNANSLYGKVQSAYRRGHSTETALLKINNDVMLALDKRLDVILVLLDLSAAFDTIDHGILLQRLNTRFGIGGNVLNWIRSYLCGRLQQVCIAGSMVSKAKPLEFGVPQGSILGPVLFSLYVTPLEDIISRHGCESMIYADDTQIYIACNSEAAVTTLENCVRDLRAWMSSNFLALNDAKTEVIHFTSKFKNSSNATSLKVNIGDCGIVPAEAVRNLGVMFNSDACMSTQVSHICKTASHSLYRLSKIRKYVNQQTAEKLVHAFISSRIDYCNSLLVGLPDYQIRRIQSIQNSAARLICGVSVRQQLHVTPLLKNLHWLPVTLRIVFKILCITFKCIHCAYAPQYLKELIIPRKVQRQLRSNDSLTLVVPNGKTLKTYGDRAFSIQAPKLWNNLPGDLRSVESYDGFKNCLKTHLLSNYYVH